MERNQLEKKQYGWRTSRHNNNGGGKGKQWRDALRRGVMRRRPDAV